jgi:site-specific recombinase XerD
MSHWQQLSLFDQDPQHTGEITRATSLRATLPLFAQHLQQAGKTAHTIAAFLGDMGLLGEYAGLSTAIGELHTDDLTRFLDWMENERGVPCSRKTYARRVTTLKVYFRWLVAIDALSVDISRPILQRSGPAPLSDVLNLRQTEACLLASERFVRQGEPDSRPVFLFRLLLETGIKKGEATRLLLEHFDTSTAGQASLFIQHDKRNVYKERRLPISDALVELLRSYRFQWALEGHVFTCTARNLEYILQAVGDEAELPFKLSFEVMRWTYAVRETLAGASEDLVRGRLGLSRPSWVETRWKIRSLAEIATRDEA